VNVTGPFTVSALAPECVSPLFVPGAAKVRPATVASTSSVTTRTDGIVMVSIAAGIPAGPVQPDHVAPALQFPVAAALQAAPNAAPGSAVTAVSRKSGTMVFGRRRSTGGMPRIERDPC